MTTKNDFKPAAVVLKKKLGALTFGALLRSIRLSEEETQDSFAMKLGMSKQQLSDIENNRKTVSAKLAASYAKKLRFSVEQFIKLSIQDSLAKNGLFYEINLLPVKKTQQDRQAHQ